MKLSERLRKETGNQAWRDDIADEVAHLEVQADAESSYGHLYLVAMRIIKDEHGDDLYWEIFEKTAAHFDALTKGVE